MLRYSSLVGIALSLVAVPACLAVTSVEKIRNEKVVVTEETLAPGETASIHGNRSGMLVILTGETAELISNSGKARRESVRRGETLALTAQEEAIKNEGSSTLSFVRIAFLTEGMHETWGMTGLSPHYKILVEDQYARAYDIRIPSQTFEPQHTHHDRVVVCLSGAQLEHILPNGEKQPSTLQTGEVVWRLGATHVGHNMGHTDLWVIAVEPK
jgi:hypothetical protein